MSGRENATQTSFTDLRGPTSCPWCTGSSCGSRRRTRRPGRRAPPRSRRPALSPSCSCRCRCRFRRRAGSAPCAPRAGAGAPDSLRRRSSAGALRARRRSARSDRCAVPPGMARLMQRQGRHNLRHDGCVSDMSWRVQVSEALFRNGLLRSAFPRTCSGCMHNK